MVKDLPADAVKINANENPLGPCGEAAESIRKIVANGGRYMYETEFEMAQTLAEQEGLKFSYDPKKSYVAAFAGSSDPLHRMVLANCTKDKPFVVADPGYEAGGRAAEYVGAQVIKVPLKASDKSHDVKAMVTAHSSPGIIYICNPNNPTGTVTSQEDIQWAVANKPKGSIILLDEAYVHFAKKTQRNSHLVAADKDVVILRTFSKIYGMAGLRAGAALGRPDLLAGMHQFTAGALPITAMVGATTSLKTKGLIEQRKAYMTGVRDDVFDFLSKNKIEFIPSDANMFMMNVNRPGRQFYADMVKQKVYIGRVWPVWPTWVRVSVGTKEEMAKFKQACLKCYTA
jgi:histidinol-phosphate/aromatic aminotransferase/cobyric acid decarboxylase-like protein